MKKRFLVYLAASVMAFVSVFTMGMTIDHAYADTPNTYEIAFITDTGTIGDHSFNQNIWEGVANFATANGISYRYYQPYEQSGDSYLAAIDLAIEGGAQIVVTQGFLFEVPIYIAQDRYPAVTFILLDGTPHSADCSDYRTSDNTITVFAIEEQAGFLAGYAAVKDGYTKLGFMGGEAVPSVVNYLYGYAQGAEYAAAELGLDAGSITLKAHYTGFLSATEAQAMAEFWYNDGVEVIFGCGGAIGNSVMAAAEQCNKKVIGVDVDQSGESETVITSALKHFDNMIYDCLVAYYAGNLTRGKIVFGADTGCVALPMDTSKFDNFSTADYVAIYSKIATGEVICLLPGEGTCVCHGKIGCPQGPSYMPCVYINLIVVQ